MLQGLSSISLVVLVFYLIKKGWDYEHKIQMMDKRIKSLENEIERSHRGEPILDDIREYRKK